MLEHWEKRRVGDLFHLSRGRVISKDEIAQNLGVFPVYSSQSKNNGELGRINSYDFDGEYLTWTTDGAQAGTVFYRSGKFNCTNVCGAAKPIDQDTTCAKFFAQLLDTYAKKYVSYIGNPKLMNAQFSEIPVVCPSIGEQRKIAEVLGTWDEAIGKLSALREAKETRLFGMREALVFGSLRIRPKGANWPARRIAEVTHEITSRNGDLALGRNLVMGVTNKQGIVPMREQTVAGDISRYKHLPPLAFAYNPMRINVGSIAMNEASETVLVSPDYVVFGCNPDGIEPDFLDHLRKTPWWAHYINSGGSGSVRQRTYYADLAALRLPLPDIDEQREIVAILNAAKADLSSTEKMIEAVKLQKRGLMQKLLTGEWRV